MGNADNIMSFQQPNIKQQVLYTKLYDGCQELTLKHIAQVLQRMFDNADDALFALAEKTDSATDSTPYFDSMRIIRLKRSEIEKQHFDFIKAAFSNLKNNTPTSNINEPTLDNLSIDDLSIIEEADLEENIAIRNIVTKVAHHCAQDLSSIEKRLSHILNIEVNAKNNPLGPEVICNSFMQVAAALDIELKVSLIILKLFDHEIIAGLTPLLQEANNTFISANVLAELKRPIQKSEHVPPPSNTGENSMENTQETAEQQARTQAGYPPSQHSNIQNNSGFAGQFSGHPNTAQNPDGTYQDTSIGHFQQLLSQQHPQGHVGEVQHGGIPMGGSNSEGGLASPNNVHSIAQAPHGAQSGGGIMSSGGTTGYSAAVGDSTVSIPQFVSSLTQLQNINMPTNETTTTVSINEGGEEVEHVNLQPTNNLKQFVIQQLQEHDENFSINNMSPVDQDVIDVVSMLFDFILEDKSIPDSAKAHIARLQIPLLKAAIIDKDFFSTNKNSARNLLNELSHAALGIIDENEPTSQNLVIEIKRVVDTINEEFEDDLNLFEEQLTIFQMFMEEHDKQESSINHKIEKKIKRKEDNALAYQWVEDTIDDILANKHLPDVIIELINGPWKKVMLNTYLNNGQDSDTWKNQIRFIDVLEWSIQPKQVSDDRQKLANIIGQLVLTLRNGLQVIQVSPDEIQTILLQLEPFHLASIKGLSVKDYLASQTPHEAFLFTPDNETSAKENTSSDDDIPELSSTATEPSDTEDTLNTYTSDLAQASLPANDIILEEIDYEADEDYETNLSLDEIDQTILKMEQELISLEEIADSMDQKEAAVEAIKNSTTETDDNIDSEERDALSQMEDDFILLGDNDSIDDEDDNFNKLITEDIILSGYNTDEQSTPQDQPQDEYLELARHLEQGKWVEFLDDNNNKTRAKLAWKSELLGEYTFLNWKFDVVADKTLYGLAADLRRGSAVIIDDIPLVDRALSAVMSSLTPTGTGNQNTSSQS